MLMDTGAKTLGRLDRRGLSRGMDRGAPADTVRLFHPELFDALSRRKDRSIMARRGWFFSFWIGAATVFGPVVRGQQPLPRDIIPGRAALARVGLEPAWFDVLPVGGDEKIIQISMAGYGKWGGTGTVLDAPSSPTAFAGDSSLSTLDDFYNGTKLTFTSGPNQGQTREVTAYDGKSRKFRFADPWSQAPGEGEAFVLKEGDLTVAQGRVFVAPATPEGFVSESASFSALKNDYIGADLVFIGGNLKGEGRTIKAYDPQSKRFVLNQPFQKAPAAGDRFSVRGGMVFIQTNHSNLYAFDAETGRRFWRVDLGGNVGRASKAAVNSSFVFATSGQSMHAVDRITGRESWRTFLEPVNFGQTSHRSGAFASSPVAATEERVMVGMTTGRLIAFNTKDHSTPKNPFSRAAGSFAWTWQTDGPITGRPIEAENFVIFGSQDGRVYVALDEPHQMFFRFPTGGKIVASMGTFGTRTLLVPSTDEKFYAIDLLSGRQLWVISTGSAVDQEPLVGDRDAFIVNRNGTLFDIDVSTGTIRWSIDSDAEDFLALGEKRVYARSQAGDLIVIDRGTGAMLSDARATRERAGLNIRPYLLGQTNRRNDRIYLATPTGVVLCLRELGRTRPLPVRDVTLPPFGTLPEPPPPGGSVALPEAGRSTLEQAEEQKKAEDKANQEQPKPTDAEKPDATDTPAKPSKPMPPDDKDER